MPTTVGEDQLKLWHARCGHLGTTNLLLLPGVATGLPRLPSGAKISDCTGCALGKATTAPFPTGGGTRTKEGKLDLVHLDVFGPFPVASLGGAF